MINKTKLLLPLNLESIQNRKENKVLIKNYSSGCLFPPISQKRRIKFEKKSSSLITKFIANLSTDLKYDTNELLNIGKKNKKKSKEKEIKKENEKEEEKKINEENKIENDKNPLMITNIKINNDIEKIKKEEITKITLKKSLSDLNNEMSSTFRKNLLNKYRRIRNYQPKIDENWKYKIGLSLSPQNFFSSLSMKNIEIQSKIIHDQIRLLIDNINYYKLNIITKDFYIEAFKTMPLTFKVRINKCLEETCGILLLLPQLLFLEFYRFIEKFKNINVPDKNKFTEQYIFDEVECLFYNNDLLSEVTDFFKNCFQVYSSLVKEVEELILKPKNFENLIIIIEKARYNVSNLISSSENGIKNYENDLRMIDKILRNEKKETKLKIKHLSLNEKMRSEFIFKMNKEKERNVRIINSLKTNKDDEYLEEIDNNNNNSNNNNKKEKKLFHSILHSKLMDGLLPYCDQNIKKIIQTRRIVDNMEINKKKIKNKKYSLE